MHFFKSKPINDHLFCFRCYLAGQGLNGNDLRLEPVQTFVSFVSFCLVENSESKGGKKGQHFQ